MIVKKINIFEDLERTPVGAVEYVDHMGEDITIVNAARVSFGKHKEAIDDKDLKLINYLVKHKHTSVFEHNTITFRFTVPLYIRSQHMRHRTWSYNEISRRYTDYDIKFYEPNAFRTQHKSNRQASNEHELVNPKLFGSTAADIITAHHSTTLNMYNLLIEAGVCKEQARGILPQNMYTQYYGTVNLNNLLKFIELRLHEGAQLEIQRVALACLRIALELWPTTIKAYMNIKGLDDIFTKDSKEICS